MAYVVSLRDIEAARVRIKPYGLHETPVVTSEWMDELSGHQAFFKCELFQKTGSFKARGATNACASLEESSASAAGGSPRSANLPVCTHSSGNHAQAIAFAARATNRKATIIMPDNAPLPKRRATEGYGACVRLCAPADRARACAAAARELGAQVVHPSEDPRVIAGQGTVALECLEQVAALLEARALSEEEAEAGQAAAAVGSKRKGRPTSWTCPQTSQEGQEEEAPLDVLVVPVGGGGLISGCAIACKAKWPSMLVVGAEPAAMDDAARSKKAGELLGNEPGVTSSYTVADGLRTQLGPNTWPPVRDLVDAVVTLEEEDILSATRLVWSRMKLQIEPSAGVGVACLMSDDLRKILQGLALGADDLGTAAAGPKSEKGPPVGEERGSPGPPAEQPRRKARVGVVLCGGNADAAELVPLFASAPKFPKGARAPTKP
mmetsp:Transcript_65026/g.146706  ORF Transcript_65026/g.146706 Transcript_65026/m.146706 type:complete len:436 (-) Transcript_65026:224-1531(-)